MQNFVYWASIICFAVAFCIAAFKCLQWLGILPYQKEITVLPNSREKIYWQEIVKLLLFVILTRVFIFFAFILVDGIAKDAPLFVARTPDNYLTRWDASHYINLAKGGYQTEGDAQNWIVFYPMYPLLIKLFSFVFVNYEVSAYIVSYVTLGFACVYLYKLVLLDYDADTAFRSVKYMLIYPWAFFLGAPFTEGPFICFTVIAIYAVRKHKWLWAGIFGAFASFTRTQGLLLLVPGVLEWCRHMREQGALEQKFIKFDWRGIGIFITVLGMGAYLLVNYAVWGDPLRFLYYQRTHWYQEFGFFAKNLHMHMGSVINGGAQDVISLWLPQVLLFFVSAGVIAAMSFCKGMRMSYVAYAIVYLFISYSPTWLLSAPRYMLSAFPLFIAMAIFTKHKLADQLMTVAFSMLLVIYILAFHIGHLVM